MYNNRRLQVSYIFRKPNPLFFSIEKIFLQIIALLKGRIDIDQVTVPHSRLRPWNLLQNFWILRKVKADIFHVTGDAHYLILAFPAKRSVLTIHDCVFMHQGGKFKSLLLKYLFLKWPVKHSAIVTTISEKSRKEIIQYTGCSPDKVTVIPNPLNQLFSYTRKEFNAAHPVILFIGSTPNKNLKRVIEALKGLSCVLDIVGKIPDDELRLLTEAGIKFRQAAGLSEEQLVNKYINCDLVLFPSTYEGFGLPIIESQQTGRPIITSDISPMKEVAGEGACLVDPYSVESIREAVCKVIRNETYRNNIIEKGLINAGDYKADRIAALYYDVYQRLN